MAQARRPNNFLQERVCRSVDNASLTADTVTTRVYAAPPNRKARLRRASYTNPTGLAVDPTNFFTINVRKNGTTVMASWSTETSVGDGAIPAGTHVELTFSATDANLVLDAGDFVDVQFDEDGTATLPAGRLDLEFDLL